MACLLILWRWICLGTSLLSHGHHVEVFACWGEKSFALVVMTKVTLFWCRWLHLSEHCLWLTDAKSDFIFFVCVWEKAEDYLCPSMHSFADQCVGTVCETVCDFAVCVFFSPIWPLDDETAAPVFWHDLSLHIRPLWWRLSAWHARICPWLINPPNTHVPAHTHTHTRITTGSPTTSCLFLSYTHTRCPTRLSITAPEKVRWTNPPCPQRDSSCLTPQVKPSPALPSAIQDQRLYPKWLESQAFVYKHCGYACIHIQSHVWALLFFWYDTWFSNECCLIEAASTLQLMNDKSTFYLLAACCGKLSPLSQQHPLSQGGVTV